MYHNYFQGKHHVNTTTLKIVWRFWLQKLIREKILYLYWYFIFFPMFLFSTSSGEVYTSLISYVEDFGNLNSYLWAFSMHESVVASLLVASKRLKEVLHATVHFGVLYCCSCKLFYFLLINFFIFKYSFLTYRLFSNIFIFLLFLFHF